MILWHFLVAGGMVGGDLKGPDGECFSFDWVDSASKLCAGP